MPERINRPVPVAVQGVVVSRTIDQAAEAPADKNAHIVLYSIIEWLCEVEAGSKRL